MTIDVMYTQVKDDDGIGVSNVIEEGEHDEVINAIGEDGGISIIDQNESESYACETTACLSK